MAANSSAAPIAVSRSGPGLLVTWTPVPNALSYSVEVARHPSPSFFALGPECCPVRPDQSLPCCPVAPSATSLQVERYAQGALRRAAGSDGYRFRVIAVVDGADNVTLGPTAPFAPAGVPLAPGAPSIAAGAAGGGAVVDLTWSAPADDGGDTVRAYRLWANVSSLGLRDVLLIGNTSAGRPDHEWRRAASSSYAALPLLPAQRYSLALQAANAAGWGAVGPAVAYDAPEPPRAEYELPVGAWRRARVARAGVARFRSFVPAAVERLGLVLQQAASPGASAAERAGLLRGSQLHLYARFGSEVGAPAAHLGRDAEDQWATQTHATPALALPSEHSSVWGREMVNVSGGGGEVSLRWEQPGSGWLYVLVHGASVSSDGVEFDLRVEQRSAALAAMEAVGREAEYDERRGGWRYWADPERRRGYSEWVVNRYVNPMT